MAVAMIRCSSCGRMNRGPRQVCLYCGMVMMVAVSSPRVTPPVRSSMPAPAHYASTPSSPTRAPERLPPRVASPAPEARTPMRPKRVATPPAPPPPPPEEELAPSDLEEEKDAEIASFLAELDRITSEFAPRTPRRRAMAAPEREGSDGPPST
jgi:hypothetical protein